MGWGVCLFFYGVGGSACIALGGGLSNVRHGFVNALSNVRQAFVNALSNVRQAFVKLRSVCTD